MRRTRGPHRWPPSLETLDHMLGASRRPGRQSRLSPPPQRDPRPAAFPPCGPRAALGPARVPPAQRPLAALGARSTSGFVCCPGRPGGAPRPRSGRPRGSLRPAAWSGRAPDKAAGLTAPGLLAWLPRGEGRAPQPPHQAQHGGGRALPTAGRVGTCGSRGRPGPRRRWKRNWGAGLQGRAPASSPISPTPSIS